MQSSIPSDVPQQPTPVARDPLTIFSLRGGSTVSSFPCACCTLCLCFSDDEE